MPWPDVRRSSVIHRPSLAFHIFDISRAKSWIELKLRGEALWQFGDSELLKLFRSDIQDGRHGSHIEILQSTSPPKP